MSIAIILYSKPLFFAKKVIQWKRTIDDVNKTDF